MSRSYRSGLPTRQAKVVCTLGPATAGRVRELAEAGMDVARVNLSHGTEAEHARAVAEVRSAAVALDRPIGLLADLPGPKIRLGSVDPDPVHLDPGTDFTLGPSTAGDASGTDVTHPTLADDVEPGDRILLADGAAELEVVATDDGHVRSRVVRGGEVRSHTGVNVPSERLSLPPVTDRDRADLVRVRELGFDLVAQSFVRRPEDVEELRALTGALSIVAKIETDAATRRFDGICRAADAVMIARGDLGVELAYEEVPALQKDLTRRATALGVPVVIATQMLESMVKAPRPTRAEASDVANAVWDGADAVMLSAETAIGAYPLEAAEAAARILGSAERGERSHTLQRTTTEVGSEPESIARAATALADQDPRVAAIACYTRTGRTASLLAATRPSVPVFAFSSSDEVVRRLTLLRAVHPRGAGRPPHTDAMIDAMDRALGRAGLPGGTLVVMVASTPVGEAETNLLKLHHTGPTQG